LAILQISKTGGNTATASEVDTSLLFVAGHARLVRFVGPWLVQTSSLADQHEVVQEQQSVAAAGWL
jgi:hypothetical protein